MRPRRRTRPFRRCRRAEVEPHRCFRAARPHTCQDLVELGGELLASAEAGPNKRQRLSDRQATTTRCALDNRKTLSTPRSLQGAPRGGATASLRRCWPCAATLSAIVGRTDGCRGSHSVNRARRAAQRLTWEPCHCLSTAHNLSGESMHLGSHRNHGPTACHIPAENAASGSDVAAHGYPSETSCRCNARCREYACGSKLCTAVRGLTS